jgi:hypothetical protein
VGGEQQQSVVEACQQPDGSWRITQNTPGLPPQVYTVPPPTEYPMAILILIITTILFIIRTGA